MTTILKDMRITQLYSKSKRTIASNLGVLRNFLWFFPQFLACSSLENNRKKHGNFFLDLQNKMVNIGLMKKVQKFDWNLRTLQAVVSHQSTLSTRRSAKTWELGQQQAMVHPRNCSSSNIRFIGLFNSCLGN